LMPNWFHPLPPLVVTPCLDAWVWVTGTWLEGREEYMYIHCTSTATVLHLHICTV
jgi:hypothetical protein